MKKLFLILGLLLLPLQALFASDNETEKLQWHLNRVEGILRKVETPTLTEDQKLNRAKMLDLLHVYIQAGKFPNNDKFQGQYAPFFRGSNGNLCAVGYLMNYDPEYQSYVETIVKINNNVNIMDIQHDPILEKWEKKYGFNTLELAMIQPTYGWDWYCYYRILGYCLNTTSIGLIAHYILFLGIIMGLCSVTFYLKKDGLKGKKYLKYFRNTITFVILIHIINYLLERLIG